MGQMSDVRIMHVVLLYGLCGRSTHKLLLHIPLLYACRCFANLPFFILCGCRSHIRRSTHSAHPRQSDSRIMEEAAAMGRAGKRVRNEVFLNDVHNLFLSRILDTFAKPAFPTG